MNKLLKLLTIIKNRFKIMEQNTQNSSENILIKRLGIIFSVFIFLLPVFFVPLTEVSLYVAKIALLATGLVTIFAVFLSSVLSTGVVEIPKAKYLLPIGLFAVVALISSAFSGFISSSVVGSVFDLGTSGSILLLVFALFMTVLSVRDIDTLGKIIWAFIYAALVLVAYTIFGSFGSAWLPAVVAAKLPSFPAGSVTDTAIIFGAAIILSLCALNMTILSKRMKIILSVLMFFAVVFIGAANFMPLTVILGIITLILFAYFLSWSFGKSAVTENITGGNRKISLSSLVVLMTFVILILGGSGIGGFLSKTMKVQTVEIRPNFETTMNLMVSSWQQNFALGVGPNRFVEFWAMHKPAAINQTQFWNSDFYAGSGFIPTMAITTGLLGLLSLLAFVGMYLFSGVKAIFVQDNQDRSRYLTTASFLVSLYFWVMFFFYTPGIAVLALAFVFTGLFTATLVPQGTIGLWKINIFSNPKTNFLAVLSIVVLLILAVAGGYFVWERAIAAVVFEKGISEYQTKGDIAAVKASTAKAISMVSSDVYWRGLTEIYLIDLQRVLGSITDKNQVTDAIKTEAQGIIASSVESAKKAVEIDNDNFQNWFALGEVYEVLAQNGIAGSAENAVSAYNEAAVRSPNNPSVPLSLARLNSLANNPTAARQNINKALELKNNYTDAYFALAQLDVAANDIPAAIKSVEATTVIDPTNSGLYFQLGLLKYNQKDYAGAASAFEQAITIAPDYANAKYYLGVSYYQLDRKAEAIKQFEDIKTTNPDNQEISTILANMKAGKSLFSNTKTTDNSKPPVAEK
jgi:tetratricopeptide (TPR) repeat protein